MSGTASGRFFWPDWLSDPGVRMCGFAARGLWMDMLCLAAQADPIGYVLVAGKAPMARDLARVLGGEVSEIEILLKELESNHVFSRDRAGKIYSRRMIRDAKRSEQKQAAGKKGGEATQGKIRGNDAAPKQAAEAHTQASGQATPIADIQAPAPPKESSLLTSHSTLLTKGSSSSAASSQEPQPPTQPDEGPRRAAVSQDRMVEIGEKACDAAGLDRGKVATDFRAIMTWMRWGSDPEGEIYPTITGVAARNRATDPSWAPKGLNYFNDAIAETIRDRNSPFPASNGAGSTQGPSATGNNHASGFKSRATIAAEKVELARKWEADGGIGPDPANPDSPNYPGAKP